MIETGVINLKFDSLDSLTTQAITHIIFHASPCPTFLYAVPFMDRLLSGFSDTIPWSSALPLFCGRAAHFTKRSLVTNIDSEDLACGYLGSACTKVQALKTSALILGSGTMADAWLTFGCFDDSVPVHTTQ